jgi:hypothetical protein
VVPKQQGADEQENAQNEVLEKLKIDLHKKKQHKKKKRTALPSPLGTTPAVPVQQVAQVIGAAHPPPPPPPPPSPANIAANTARATFSSEVPPSTFYDQLYARQNPPDCSKVEKVSCDISSSYLGFGYQLHQITKCMLAAFRSGKTAVLHPARLGRYAAEHNSQWDYFFKPISTCEGPAPQAYMDDSIKDWFPPGIELPAAMQISKYTFVVGTVEKYLMRPSERLQKRLDAEAKPSDFGMHVRRTDKISMAEAWSHELEQYMQAVDRIATPTWNFHSTYGRKFGKTLFIATDESAVLDEAKRKFSQYDVRHGSGAQVDRYSAEGLDLFLVELFSLINTQYFVGTFSSQVSRIVYEIYHTKFVDAYHRAWSLDDPWYGDGYSLSFPAEGVQHPPAMYNMPLPPATVVPPPSTLYDKLYKHQNPADCSKVQLAACDVSTSFLGFGYQLHQIAKCMIAAYAAGRVAVLHPNKLGKYGPECGSDWTCFFQPISSCSGPAPPMLIDDAQFKNWVPADLELPPTIRNKGIFVVGTVEKYLLRPSSRLQARLDAGKVTANFGAHIRRTDKITSQEAWSHSVEQYMQALDRIAMPHWNFHSAYGRKFGKSVFVATDDAAVLQEVRSRYPQYNVLAGSGASVDRYSMEGLDRFLEELFALASTEYFVGTFSSQVSRIVYELFHTKYSMPDHHAWSLDDPWYGDGYELDFPKE